MPEGEILVTKMLADAGYTCGLAGKLHLSACMPIVCEKMERRIDDGYSEFHWSHHPQPGWGLHNEYWQWLASQGESYHPRPHPETPHVKLGMPADLHQTMWCAEKACEFIETADAGNPWLFSLNIFDPHHPFDPPEEYMGRYMDRLEEIPLPNYVEGELEHKTEWQRLDHRSAYNAPGWGLYPYDRMSETEHRLARAAYWAQCDLIDTAVGKILASLERTHQADNTVVIFMADHGEMLGDHGIYLKGPYFYEPAIRVPLIISWPEQFPARRCPALVELMDLPQTLLDITGIPHHEGMQGQSLYSLLKAPDVANHKEDVYCEYYNALPSHGPVTAQTTMIRTTRYKLAVNHVDSSGELYDLVEDPRETTNLWTDPQYAQVKTDLLVRLTNRMAWTVDPLPERVAGW